MTKHTHFNIYFYLIFLCRFSKERKTKLRAPKFPSRREKKFLRDVTSPKLSHLAQKLAEPSAIGKRSILLEEDERTLANILADEVREAKRKVRAWQEAIASRKCDVRRVRTTDVIVQEKSRGKKRKADSGDDESPARDATESSRSDFRQLAKMRTEAWRSVSESEHETSRERGKGQARKLEAFHLGKYEQKGGTDASSSTLYQWINGDDDGEDNGDEDDDNNDDENQQRGKQEQQLII